MKNIYYILVSFLFVLFPLSASTVVVFDFGGVVHKIDDKVLAKKVKKSLHIDAKAAKKLVKKAHAHPNDPAFWSKYQAKTGATFPNNWSNYFEKMKSESLRLDPRIVDLIDRLKRKGCMVALLSNVGHEHAQLLRRLGLYKPFDPVVLSCEIGVSKPKKNAFLILLRRLGNVKAQNCIFIDDKKENVAAAKALGFTAIHFHSVSNLRWELQIRQLLAPQPFKPKKNRSRHGL